MAFGMMGKAIGGMGKAAMNAPGMGAIRKPLQAGMQATPGLKSVGKGMGLGPSQPQQQNVGGLAGIRQKMQPQPQSALQNMAQGGGGVMNAFGGRQAAMGPMQQPPVSQQPPPAAAPASPPQQIQPEQVTPEMQDQKLQQMAALFGQMSPSGMAQPHVMPRFGIGGNQMGGFGQGGGMMQNKLRQMMMQRRGGIGPSMQPQQEMTQQEPEMY